jgi:hypothetical protein
MHISVAATEAREDTYISRNMTGRLEVESSVPPLLASSNLCASHFLAVKLNLIDRPKA